MAFSSEGHSFLMVQEVQASLHQAWNPSDYSDPSAYLEDHMEAVVAFLAAYRDSWAFAEQNLDPCYLEVPSDNFRAFQVACCCYAYLEPHGY